MPYPYPTSEAVSAVMRANRKTDSGPERALRAALHRQGLRFRKNRLITTPHLQTRADIVFPADKVAVFVDGCYWHSCPDHGTSPRQNTAYWGPKLARNRERDGQVIRALGQEGWLVLRIWEHEAKLVMTALAARRASAGVP